MSTTGWHVSIAAAGPTGLKAKGKAYLDSASYDVMNGCELATSLAEPWEEARRLRIAGVEILDDGLAVVERDSTILDGRSQLLPRGVDHRRHPPVLGREADDGVRAQQVGVDPALGTLELVELPHGVSVFQHAHLPQELHRFRVTKLEHRRTIAHHQRGPVVAEAPALTAVAERLACFESAQLRHEGESRAPCELNQALANPLQPFAEEFWPELALREHFAVFEPNLA